MEKESKNQVGSCEFIRSTDGLRCYKKATRLGPFCKSHAYYIKRKGEKSNESWDSPSPRSESSQFEVMHDMSPKRRKYESEMVIYSSSSPLSSPTIRVCDYCTGSGWNTGSYCQEHQAFLLNQKTLQTAQILVNLQSHGRLN
jgi:hypothetical protein